MKSIVCLIVFVVYGLNLALTASVQQPNGIDELWDAFKAKHSKVYASLEEELHRKKN